MEPRTRWQVGLLTLMQFKLIQQTKEQASKFPKVAAPRLSLDDMV